MDSMALDGGTSAMIDHIPAVWVEPDAGTRGAPLVIWQPGLTSTKEDMLPYLRVLALAGFVGLSYDPWQHGARGTESRQELGARVFGNPRRHLWPIKGQTALDMLRVIDWAIATLGVRPEVYAGGISMGGDVAVTAAGLDPRITRVAAVVASPDWLRPGMRDLFSPERVLPPGEPDAYARYFYDALDPLTHLASYAHGPAITFECGAADTHVPPDGALRFQAALRAAYPAAGERTRVSLHPGLGHFDGQHADLWQNSLDWFREG